MKHFDVKDVGKFELTRRTIGILCCQMKVDNDNKCLRDIYCKTDVHSLLKLTLDDNVANL